MSYARVFWLLYLQRKSDLKEVQLTIKAMTTIPLSIGIQDVFEDYKSVLWDLEVHTNSTIAQKCAKIKVSVLAKNVF